MELKDIEALGEDNLESTPAFVMSTAAEALDLLGHYSMDFHDREEDRDALASMCVLLPHT